MAGALVVGMTDEERTPDLAAFAGSLPRGAIIIFRHYDSPEREELAGILRRVTRRRQQTMLVAGDASLARRVGADGLHVGRSKLFQRMPTAIPVVSAACHDIRALHRIHGLGIPLALVSPVFPTASHPGSPVLDIHKLSRMMSWHHVDCVALGGIQMATAGRLSGVGGSRRNRLRGLSNRRHSGPVGIAAIDGLAKPGSQPNKGAEFV